MRPDAKAQVTVEFSDDNVPQRVDAVVISTQHDPDVSLDTIKQDVVEKVIKQVIPAKYIDENTRYFINQRTFCYWWATWRCWFNG